MAIVVFCPGCRVRLTLGDDRAGTTFGCPKCKTPISLPRAAAADTAAVRADRARGRPSWRTGGRLRRHLPP